MLVSRGSVLRKWRMLLGFVKEFIRSDSGKLYGKNYLYKFGWS